MDLVRIALGSLTAYAYLLIVLRLTGKRIVTTAAPFDFVLSLVVGDAVDDAIFREVPLLQFLVAVTTLVLVRVAIGCVGLRGRERDPSPHG